MIKKTDWSKAHATADEFGKQKREEIREIRVKADRVRAQRDAKQKNLSRVTRIKGSPYDAERVIDMQEQLRKAGYNIAADGLWGPRAQKAYDDYLAKQQQEAKQDLLKNNPVIMGGVLSGTPYPMDIPRTPYQIATRLAFRPGENIYPYAFDPDVSYDKNNIQAYNDVLNLDLNTKEGQQKMQEILSRTKEDGKTPVFDGFVGSSRRNYTNLQNKFRERYDLTMLSQGKEQKYNSFVPYEYNGETYYKFSNDDLNKKYLQNAKASIQKYGVNENGYVVPKRKVKLEDGREVEREFVPIDLTHALMNQYSIRQNNNDGTIEVYDDWDFPLLDKLEMGQESPRIRIVGKPNTIQVGNAEGLIYPNSIYTDRSRYYYSSDPIPVGRNGYDEDGNVSLAQSAGNRIWQKVKEKYKQITK